MLVKSLLSFCAFILSNQPWNVTRFNIGINYLHVPKCQRLYPVFAIEKQILLMVVGDADGREKNLTRYPWAAEVM